MVPSINTNSPPVTQQQDFHSQHLPRQRNLWEALQEPPCAQALPFATAVSGDEILMILARFSYAMLVICPSYSLIYK